MGRPNSLDRLDAPTRRRALAAARRAKTLNDRIARKQREHDERVAALEAQRNQAWTEACDLGMSRTEAARVAGLHHSAVDRALA